MTLAKAKQLLQHKQSTDTIYQLLARGVVISFSVLSTIILRRNYDASQYGIYIYLTNYVMLLLSFFDIGTHLTLVREVSINKTNRSQTLSTFIQLRSLILIIITATALIIPNLINLDPILKAGIPIATTLLVALAFKETLAVIYHSLNKLNVTSIIHSIAVSLSFIAILITAITYSPITTIFAIQAGLTLIIAIPLFKRIIVTQHLTLHTDLAAIKCFFVQAVPLGGTLIIFTVYSRIDTILIEHFYSVKEVGIYGLSYKIYDNLVLPAAFILNSLLPNLAIQAEQRSHRLYNTIKKSALTLTGISIVIIVLIHIAAPFIINILTGEYAVGEIVALKVLSLATIFAYLNHLTGYMIVALKLQVKALKIALIALLVNLGFNLYFLPQYGFIAAAYITILTEATVLIGSSMIITKHLRNHHT